MINIDFSLRKRLYPVIFESVLEGGSEDSWPPIGSDVVFVQKRPFHIAVSEAPPPRRNKILIYAKGGMH